jgi:hypothetical protein
MVAYCVVTTFLLSLVGVRVVKGRHRRRARASSEEQDATAPTLPGLEVGPLVDIATEQRALGHLDAEQLPLGNPGLEIPFELVMSNILRNQNMNSNPFY